MAGLKNFSLKARTNAVFRLSEEESVYFAELYASIKYYAFQVDAERFKQLIGTNNHELSAGSMMVSNKAVPVNKISLSNPNFANISGTNGFLEYKGLFILGWDPCLHQKYLYLRFNIENFSDTGGFVHNVVWADNRGPTKLLQLFADFLKVVTGIGSPDSSDVSGIGKINVLENSVAAYV